ncbi:GAF domain-containing sensor histidine kinase [Aquiflexum lacus]|uniref:GAF domain-containing sensor histidine kinase n=1 Tax=Aquiflexum lacus TaxID=2483805 RepID=UPI001893C65D|nr:GAF domain-containing sensor histidine kinase [Aquiflexum lacus]
MLTTQTLVSPHVPKNEFERLVELSNYDLDYSSLEGHFKDLTKLAAKIAGTEISLINLIDSFTQWSVAGYGFPAVQMDREETVCQYTILGDSPFEVRDLSDDVRFKEKTFVKEEPKLRYYWGIPLATPNGHNLGALCVLDKKMKTISPEKVEMLRIIGDEIVSRLSLLRDMDELKKSMSTIREDHKRVAHDIRGPIGGIIGLAQILQDQGDDNNLEEVLEFIHLIKKSGKSLLEMADDVLSQNFHSRNRPKLNKKLEYNLFTLKEKIYDLYAVQAKQKEVALSVHLKSQNGDIPFPKNKLLQILGNLISNAIKFTPKYGNVEMHLSLAEKEDGNWLIVSVRDNGLGISQERIQEILSGKTNSSQGTKGEKGYGFGLPLVKHLVDTYHGKIKIKSELGLYSLFLVRLPVGR